MFYITRYRGYTPKASHVIMRPIWKMLISNYTIDSIIAYWETVTCPKLLP